MAENTQCNCELCQTNWHLGSDGENWFTPQPEKVPADAPDIWRITAEQAARLAAIVV